MSRDDIDMEALCAAAEKHDAAMLAVVPVDGCRCWTCNEATRVRLDWPDRLLYRSFMIVCPKCGNKRCPHATHHDNDCSGSNASGQPGSRYR